MSEVAGRVQERIGRREQQAWGSALGRTWVLADCERDRRALARAVAQAERHERLAGDSDAATCVYCHTLGPNDCPDRRDADDALADLDVKYEAWA